MTTVVIGGKSYPYLFGLQAMAIYERITGESWGASTSTKSTVSAHFACLVAADNSFPMSFSEFVSKIDCKQAVEALGEALSAEVARWGGLNDITSHDAPGEDSTKKKKKK